MDRPYVSLSNLTTFWSAVKQYIDNTSGGGGINPEIEAIVQELSTKLDTEITDRSDADTELNRLIDTINTYTVNAQPISESPVLSGDDIPYSSDIDDVSVYSKVNSIDQDVSGIKSGYVKSIKGEGVNIDVTPTTSSNGDVTIKVDATTLKNKVDAIDGYTVNSKPISSNPTLTGNDITLGVSVGDNTNYPTTKTVTSSIQTLRETIAGLGQVMEIKGVVASLPQNTTGYENGDVIIVGNKEYLCYNSAWHLLGDVTELSQDVSTIKSSYVKSITCEGANGVTVTPTTASNGDVSIKVDALTLNQKFANYLPLSGGTMTGSTQVNSSTFPAFVLNHTGSQPQSGIRFEINGADKGYVGYHNSCGTYLWSSAAEKYLCIADDGEAYVRSASVANKVIHSGNYSSYTLPLSGGTVTGSTTFNEEVKMIKTGSSDICIGVACDFKSNRSQISNLITNYIYLGRESTDKNIRFRSYSTISSAAPSSITDLLVIGSSGCIASNFITTSDRRVKKNITEITDASKSLGLKFYEFDYVNNDNHSAGHVAQEVKEVLPEFVHGNESETEHLSIDYTGLHSVQIKALKDEIDLLKKENEELKKSNNELNTRVEKLERLIEKLV